MILANGKKRHVKIEGDESQILTELSVIIEELTDDIEIENIMFAVKLGLTGDDFGKKLDLLMESLKEKLEKESGDKK